ncbi:hypothetical protein [Candidatus Bathycorpusculum sp.]|uniref:hypothetical protein n=1 Tax=Candidatus Bathycorpusculum sp. TaxID=2994959 RepID=UPI002831F255|nr:hypothetical protein [Candidatus Termitimicrobium sp.]MCL2685712.1 hypothetical protein [Candidatus Termitimicrobium sp.]
MSLRRSSIVLGEDGVALGAGGVNQYSPKQPPNHKTTNNNPTTTQQQPNNNPTTKQTLNLRQKQTTKQMCIPTANNQSMEPKLPESTPC